MNNEVTDTNSSVLSVGDIVRYAGSTDPICIGRVSKILTRSDMEGGSSVVQVSYPDREIILFETEAVEFRWFDHDRSYDCCPGLEKV